MCNWGPQNWKINVTLCILHGHHVHSLSMITFQFNNNFRLQDISLECVGYTCPCYLNPTRCIKLRDDESPKIKNIVLHVSSAFVPLLY